MQKENKEKFTDFISFLKKQWSASGVLFRESKLGAEEEAEKGGNDLPAVEKARRFYRSLEEGKLNKVLNTVVSESEEKAREDIDDVSVAKWQSLKASSEQDIINSAPRKSKDYKKNIKILTNPANHVILEGNDRAGGKMFSYAKPGFAWKLTATAMFVLMFSVGYVNLYPQKAQETIDRLDLVMTSPVTQSIALARHLRIIPEPDYGDKFVNKLPETRSAINSEVKSDYIRNLNKPLKTMADGGRIQVEEKSLRGDLGEVDADQKIVVLGIDSEEDKKESRIIGSIKSFLRKVAEKQEQLSLDLNDKLIEMID